MEAFRERNQPKVENDPFLLHLTPNFLARDENGFFSILNAETLRKPTVSGTFPYSGNMQVEQDFTFSLLVKNPMEFQ